MNNSIMNTLKAGDIVGHKDVKGVRFKILSIKETTAKVQNIDISNEYLHAYYNFLLKSLKLISPLVIERFEGYEQFYDAHV